MDNLRTLVYKNNEFGCNSLRELKVLLDKILPYNLQELKLVHCELTQNDLTEKLVLHLREEECNLSSLTLSGMKLT